MCHNRLLSLSLLWLLLSLPTINASTDTIGGAGSVLIWPNPIIASHQRLHMQLAAKLIALGHPVTIARFHPDQPGTMEGMVPPPPGATVINLQGPFNKDDNREYIMRKIEEPMWKTYDGFLDHLTFMIGGCWQREFCHGACVAMQQRHGDVMRRIKAANFSLAVLDPHAFPCSWIILNHLQIPYIELVPSIPVYYQEKAVNTPTPFAYTPAINNGLTDRMDFLQRIKNFFDHPIFSSSFLWVVAAWCTQFLTGWTETGADPLMGIFLDDKKFAFSRPYANSLVTSGLKELIRTPIVDSLSTFTNDPESKGTIIFSLTTLGKKERMPDEWRQIFLDVFRKFTDYRIIWRTTEPPNVRDNSDDTHITYTKWFNQTNLFADPKTKLLITHGGISTILEAARHGVTMLGFPLGYDHHGNFARVISRGMGVKVTKETINRNRLSDAMRLLLEDSGVRHRVTQMRDMLESSSSLFDDEMLWYTRFAVRHGERLRRLAPFGERKLNHIQYFCGDIVVSLLLVSLLVVKICL